MAFTLFDSIQGWLQSLCRGVKQRLRQWTRPDNGNDSLAVGIALDLTRSKSELVLENALLRQQLIVLQRQVKRPPLTWRDRALFVLIASKLPSWRSALMIVQPDTLLRWHRDLFRRVWRRKSKRKGKGGRQPLAEEIVTLIVFVIIELESRRLVHFGVTRSPGDDWVAQQLRSTATSFGEGPGFLIRDNDDKYGDAFAGVADGSGIEVLPTPYQAPKANVPKVRANLRAISGQRAARMPGLRPNVVRLDPERAPSAQDHEAVPGLL